MPDLELDLDAIEAKANAATPGPWAECVFAENYATVPDERGVHLPDDPATYQKPDSTWHTVHVCRGMAGPNREANATFIAAARTDVPALCAEVRRLRAALAAEREQRQTQWVERAPLYLADEAADAG